MKKRILSALVSALLVSTIFAGCGTNTASGSKATEESSSSEVVEAKEESSSEAEKTQTPTELSLYVYYADAAIEQVDKTLEELKKIYPDLTLKIDHRTDSDGSVLKTRAAVGELPDIFESSGQLTEVLQKSGDLYNLKDAFKESGIESKFIPGVFDKKVTPEGDYYAVQADTPSTYTIFYNKDVFGELKLSPPKNYDEFKTVVKTLKDNGKIPLSLFAQQKWPGLQLFDLAIIGQGQLEGLSGLEDGKNKITDEPYVKAANKLSELVSLGLVGKGALNTNASQAFELLATGAAGMLGNGAWYFNDATLGGYGDKLDYFEYNPFVDKGDEEKYRYNMSGGQGAVGGYAVSAKGKDPAFAAKVLMSYIEEHDKVCAVLGSINPLVEDIKPAVARPDFYQKYADSVKDFKTLSKYEWALNNQELIVALEDNSELLLTGTFKPDQFIKDLEAQISDAINR